MVHTFNFLVFYFLTDPMHSCTAVKFRCDVKPCSNNILQLDSFVLCDIEGKKCFTVTTAATDMDGTLPH